MSDSVKKFHELEDTVTVSINQKQVEVICEIVRASTKSKMTKDLVKKALKISNKAPLLSPSVVFQIAGDDLKIDELCGKNKEKNGTTKN
jgi:hypothetical protein